MRRVRPFNPIADVGSLSIEHGSAWGELFARDNYERRSKNALQLGGRNETHCDTLPPFDPETGAKA
jgi:hypothetical protein